MCKCRFAPLLRGRGGQAVVGHWRPPGRGSRPARATPVWRKAGLSFSHEVGVTVPPPPGRLRGSGEFVVGRKCLGPAPADSKLSNTGPPSSHEHLGLQGSSPRCDLKRPPPPKWPRAYDLPRRSADGRSLQQTRVPVSPRPPSLRLSSGPRARCAGWETGTSRGGEGAQKVRLQFRGCQTRWEHSGLAAPPPPPPRKSPAPAGPA